MLWIVGLICKLLCWGPSCILGCAVCICVCPTVAIGCRVTVSSEHYFQVMHSCGVAPNS
jgi:hypothetical protein